jgi:hypothetical protein
MVEPPNLHRPVQPAGRVGTGQFVGRRQVGPVGRRRDARGGQLDRAGDTVGSRPRGLDDSTCAGEGSLDYLRCNPERVVVVALVLHVADSDRPGGTGAGCIERLRTRQRQKRDPEREHEQLLPGAGRPVEPTARGARQDQRAQEIHEPSRNTPSERPKQHQVKGRQALPRRSSAAHRPATGTTPWPDCLRTAIRSARAVEHAQRKTPDETHGPDHPRRLGHGAGCGLRRLGAGQLASALRDSCRRG